MSRRFLYVSKATSEFARASLDELVHLAQAANAAIGVTGFLFYTEGRFFQFIEGPDAPLIDLMSRIDRDDRHTVIRRAESESLSSRLFPNWSMHEFSATHPFGVALSTLMFSREIDRYLSEGGGLPDYLIDSWDRLAWLVVDGYSTHFEVGSTH